MRCFASAFTFLLVFFLFGSVDDLKAQLSVANLNLAYGEHAVGYQHRLMYDSTRTYVRAPDYLDEAKARPIPLSIWYPAQIVEGEDHLTVFDYLKVLRDEEEWESLPDSLIMTWFEFPDIPGNRERIKEHTRAIADAKALPGKYPVVVYAASFLASSTENFAFCELLASQGYIVLAAPGRGAGGRAMRGSAPRNAEAQARDLEFLIAEAAKLPYTDASNLALMDYSFGGLATAMVAMRNRNVKAVVSLDGRSRYDYASILASPSVDLNRFRTPFLHAAQKVIPKEVLEADKIDPALNTEFRLRDSLRKSSVISLRFHDLSHRHFSAFGFLLKPADQRQDKNDVETMFSINILSQYVVNFLGLHLQGEYQRERFLIDPGQNGIETQMLSIDYKHPEKEAYDFPAFLREYPRLDFQQLSAAYAKAVQVHPDFEIPEWQLNDLGLRLGFSVETYERAVLIYLFALELYPESANLYDSLGLIHQVNGNYQEAIFNFRKSLKLNPENGHAIMRIKQMGE